MAVGALSSSAPVVVASIGACGSGGSTLLNELFRTDLPVAPRRGVQTTLGVVEAEVPSLPAVVLDVEGFDSRDRSRAEDQARAMKWAFCVADMVIYNIRFTDLGRSDGLSVAALGACVEEELRLRASGVLPSGSAPKLLLVVVRDWDGVGLSREELVEACTGALQSMLQAVSLPEGVSAPHLADLFNVHYVLLPHRQLCRSQWDDTLVDVAGLFERKVGAAASAAGRGATATWPPPSGLPSPRARATPLSGAVEVPPEAELAATYACEATMKAVEARYLRNVQPWKVDTGAGRLVRDFGRQAGETLDQTLDAFAADASAHGSTERLSASGRSSAPPSSPTSTGCTQSSWSSCGSSRTRCFATTSRASASPRRWRRMWMGRSRLPKSSLCPRPTTWSCRARVGATTRSGPSWSNTCAKTRRSGCSRPACRACTPNPCGSRWRSASTTWPRPWPGLSTRGFPKSNRPRT
eukprot:TRINITY_DN3965_c0_g1_i4.p1 TRINITY_DN3965_c0_g1~~TRINITY_DN3965_c0_g1_i4.p1  ORF type:complete len:467 (+),score=60.70 TRINITY_DN3965_c0_g1_i4:203-1603(+)